MEIKIWKREKRARDSTVDKIFLKYSNENRVVEIEFGKGNIR